MFHNTAEKREKSDKRLINPRQNSKILNEKTFGRKFSSFERFLQTTGLQAFSTDFQNFGVASLKKVNAAEKFGVDFFARSGSAGSKNSAKFSK
ncbi:MAG: hypothetical protein IJ243_08765 [Prevotella sp.]|nr:hypothetical protein [Prevotella sp.]